MVSATSSSVVLLLDRELEHYVTYWMISSGMKAEDAEEKRSPKTYGTESLMVSSFTVQLWSFFEGFIYSRCRSQENICLSIGSCIKFKMSGISQFTTYRAPFSNFPMDCILNMIVCIAQLDSNSSEEHTTWNVLI